LPHRAAVKRRSAERLAVRADEGDDRVVGTGATKESLQSAREYIKPEDRS